jgi:hypothetical protein
MSSRVSAICSRWAQQAKTLSTAAPSGARSFGTHHAHPKQVGILAMEMYVPQRYVAQDKLEAADGVSAGKYTIGESRMALPHRRPYRAQGLGHLIFHLRAGFLNGGEREEREHLCAAWAALWVNQVGGGARRGDELTFRADRAENPPPLTTWARFRRRASCPKLLTSCSQPSPCFALSLFRAQVSARRTWPSWMTARTSTPSP